ncbi:hypothetical protein ACA910_011788 [Epithemia clementina (nom. ined.)]
METSRHFGSNGKYPTQLQALPWLWCSTVTAESSKFVSTGAVTATAVTFLRGGAKAAVTANWAVVASGGAGDIAEIVNSTYHWCINLGAPSALVAGAVIATVYEYIGRGALDEDEDDDSIGQGMTGVAGSFQWIIHLGRRLTRVLLVSAFALEIMSILATTVSGTMLLSRTLDLMDEMVPIAEGTTPLQFFKENFELEYLTARITFLQGLLNWVAAIALGHIVPQRNDSRSGNNSKENKDARYMDQFIGSSLLTILVVMVALYNSHMTFYNNYGHMLLRWITLLVQRFILRSNHHFLYCFRPMAFIYIPSAVVTTYYGLKALFLYHHHHDDDGQ